MDLAWNHVAGDAGFLSDHLLLDGLAVKVTSLRHSPCKHNDLLGVTSDFLVMASVLHNTDLGQNQTV